MHTPKILNKSIHILLYMDDIIFIMKSHAGLRRLFWKLDAYCAINSLTINKAKNKAMVFGKRHTKYNRYMEREPIEHQLFFMPRDSFHQYRFVDKPS